MLTWSMQHYSTGGSTFGHPLSVLICGVVSFVGWSHLWDGLICGMVLFVGWSYLWDGLICGMV